MELESAIQELLSRLEFVSLPGLGSFVKKYETASRSADGTSFNPPREFYVFDAQRTFNDEALENFVSEKNNVDHPTASEIVAKFTSTVKEKLEANANVTFPGVGVLSKAANGNISLTPTENTFSQTFGLGSVTTPQSSTPKKEEPTVQKKQVTVEPTPKPAALAQKKENKVSHKSSGKILVPAIVILAFVAIALTLYFVPELHFWENLKSSTNTPIAQDTIKAEPATPSALADVQGSDSLIQTTTEPVAVDSIQDEQPKTTQPVAVTNKKEALYYQETEQSENKTFYIIAGSFAQEDNAQKLIQDLSAKGYKPTLMKTDNIYRVAIYKFSNRDRALRELERLKSQKVSNTVWLLTL